MIDLLGHHGLSCRYSAGRLPRHANLNDVVKRGLAMAGIPSWLEPVGLDRGDGRRPDGITVFPYSGGKCLCWDATCVDTFSQSSVMESALHPGSAAMAAESRKRDNYAALSTRYRFEAVAVETSGVIGPSSSEFLNGLGRRMIACTGDRRETQWLIHPAVRDSCNPSVGSHQLKQGFSTPGPRTGTGPWLNQYRAAVKLSSVDRSAVRKKLRR